MFTAPTGAGRKQHAKFTAKHAGMGGQRGEILDRFPANMRDHYAGDGTPRHTRDPALQGSPDSPVSIFPHAYSIARSGATSHMLDSRACRANGIAHRLCATDWERTLGVLIGSED
jgi:hypothetical protein